MSDHLEGLNPHVVELTIAVIAKDKGHIAVAAGEIANYLKMNGGLMQALMELVMCDFNPGNEEKQRSFGRAELAIRRLFN